MNAIRISIALFAGLVLAACSGSGDEELRQWMTDQRTQVRPKVKPLDEPKQFIPQAYTQDGMVDPFSLQKLTQALRSESTQVTANAALVAPELARRKEPLEAYPLDAMTMVGSLQRAGEPVALVRIDNLLHQVRVGNHLGLNYGRVTKIGETEISLREVVQDGTGDWIERTASLALQERAK